jgi:hypothetical protein
VLLPDGRRADALAPLLHTPGQGGGEPNPRRGQGRVMASSTSGSSTAARVPLDPVRPPLARWWRSRDGVPPHLGGSSSCFRRRKLCPWRGISGHERRRARAQAIFLRVNAPLLPPSPRTLRWRPPSLPVSAASLLPSASAMRRSSSSATLERRATHVEGTAGSPRCGEEAASSGEGEGHSSTATAARSSFHDSEHRRKVVGAAAADAWWGRRRLTEPPPSLRIWRNWRPTPF